MVVGDDCAGVVVAGAGDGVVVIVAVARRWNSQHGASSMEQPEQTPEIARKIACTHEHKQLQQPY